MYDDDEEEDSKIKRTAKAVGIGAGVVTVYTLGCVVQCVLLALSVMFGLWILAQVFG